MINKKVAREWHLYSAVAIISVLTLISIVFFKETTQTIGVSFSTIVGMFLFSSEKWKYQPIEIHIYSIIISIIVLMITTTIIFFLNNNSRHQN